MAITPPTALPGAAAMFTLDPSMTHLNHGSVGAVPLPVRHARDRITEELEADPRGFFKTRVERTTTARHAICDYLGLDPGRTALVRNIASGVAQVLAVISPGSGDEIVTTDHGYGSVGFNVDAWARRAGVVHRVAQLPLNFETDEFIDRVLAQVSDRTRLVIVDQITSSTARLMPVAELAPRLRERRVPLLVDAAHVPGHLSVAASAVDADFWVGNLHKWLFAPRGTAVLAVRDEWVPHMRPLLESWLHEAGFPQATEYNGTDDFTGWLAAPTGIDLMRAWGFERVSDHNARLVRYGQHVLAEALGVAVDDPDPGPLGMRLVRLPTGSGTTPEHADAIEAAVRAELHTELAVNAFGGQGLIRIAAQVYNTPGHYELLAERLPGLLDRWR